LVKVHVNHSFCYFVSHASPRILHALPTRRSSDLRSSPPAPSFALSSTTRPTKVEGFTVTHVTDRAQAPDGRTPEDFRRTVTYSDAGVSIHAGAEAVELLKNKVHRTWRPEVVGDIGGFAGLFRLDIAKYKKPLLASSTDGVGTKLVIAQQMDVHDTVGVDLVAMVVDDLVACGAEPLFLLDYIACGEVVPDKVAAIAAGIAD